MLNAITLTSVSKKYVLAKERPLLLKNIFASSKKEEIWALKDISLEIKKGETIGIIGENGSGKSTLLKIISGITTPTSGKVEVNGRVASLIELGAGFQPDLTGKENVYLNGTLLGLTKKEIDKKYTEIVDFADIPEFIDQPVRTYSSGMTVRLGFSVAVHLEPDILLVDEVLAVGDEEFQRKCIEKISDIKNSKKTIVLVSHNLNLLSSICERTIWINSGNIKAFNSTNKVVSFYLKSIKREKDTNRDNGKYKSKSNRSKLKITKIKVLDINGKEKDLFHTGDTLRIQIYYHSKEIIKHPNFGVAIHRADGLYCYGVNTSINKVIPKYIKGKGFVEIIYPMFPLLSGSYLLEIAIYDKTELEVLDCIPKNVGFTIINESLEQGVVYIQHSWLFGNK